MLLLRMQEIQDETTKATRVDHVTAANNKYMESVTNVKSAEKFVFFAESDTDDSEKTMNWNKEPKDLLYHLKRWSHYLYLVFIFLPYPSYITSRP